MKAKPKAMPRAVRVGGLGVSFDMSDRPGLNGPMSALDKSRTPLARMPDMSLRLVGNLDLVDPDGVVEGWCWAPDEPGSRRVLSLLIDGAEAARVICDEFRPDLVSAGVGDGAHAFLVVLSPEQRRPGQNCIISLRDAVTQQMVGGTASILWRDTEGAPAAPRQNDAYVMQGHLDGATKDGRVSGWCWYPGHPQEHVRLQILVDDEPVGVAAAINFRADLQVAGIGDGTHGFSFALPWSVLSGKGTLTVQVRDELTGIKLGSPILLRLGRMAEQEDRVGELERQIRMLRAQVDELTRELDQRADEQPLSDMFATFGALFNALATAPSSQAVPRVLESWRQKDVLPASIDPGELLRRALTDLRARLAPFDLAIPDRPEATIVIPGHADADTLYRCLLALREAGVDRRADIVLLDLAVGGGHAAALMPSLVRNVQLLSPKDGGGLAESLAELALSARGGLLGLIDPDVTVGPGWFDEMAATMAREPQAGLVASKVVGADGLIRHAGLLNGAGGLPEAFGLHDDASLPDYGFLRDVDGVGALAFVVRRDLLGPSSFSGRQAGCVVLDLCLRLRQAGHAVMLQPQALATCGDQMELAGRIADLAGPEDDAAQLRHLWFDAGHAPASVHFAGHALVIDNDVPRPDRDAGSVATLEQMQLLRRLGYRVSFAPAASGLRHDPAADQLQAFGIELIGAPHYVSITDYLANHGKGLSLVQIYRHMNAAMFIDRVREMAPQARLVFSPADLHHVREMRHATIAGLPHSEAGARETREQEMLCVRHADATILTSDYELTLLAPEVEPGKLRLLRWITRPLPSPRGFAERSGLCFVGNYRHGPNVDGMLWFVQSVMPRLRARRAGLTLHIAGSEMTDEIRALAASDVKVHGWVEDLTDMLGQVRLSVAPLRFGAGFKGKVAMSLAHGVPVVGTAIAIEGTGLLHGEGVMVADDAEAFAEQVLRLHDDAALWECLSSSGIDRCTALYSPEAALNVYRGMLHDFGLPARTG